MKGKTLSAVGLVALAAGAALILFNTAINSGNIVIGAGIAFALVGVVNLILIAGTRRSGSMARALTQIANGGAIILGVCMMVFKSVFMSIVPFIFGIMAAVCALWQFFMLAMGTEPYRLPGWLYVFPLAITGLAVWIFIERSSVFADESMLILLTGCALALTGVGSIVEGLILGHHRRAAEQTARPDTEAPKPAIAAEETPKSEPASDSEPKQSSDDSQDSDTPLS